MKKFINVLIGLCSIFLVATSIIFYKSDMNNRKRQKQIREELNNAVKEEFYYGVSRSNNFDYVVSEYHEVQNYYYKYELKGETWHITQLRKEKGGDIHIYDIKPKLVYFFILRNFFGRKVQKYRNSFCEKVQKYVNLQSTTDGNLYDLVENSWRICYCCLTIADSEILVRQVAPPKMSYSLPLST